MEKKRCKKDLEIIVIGIIFLFMLTLTANQPAITGYAGVVVYKKYVNDTKKLDNITEENKYPPKILTYYPAKEIININQFQDQEFHITKQDKDNSTLETQWYINNTKIPAQIFDKYVFLGSNSFYGDFNITVIVDDGKFSDTKSWFLIVNKTKEFIKEECIGPCCYKECYETIITCPKGYQASCPNTCDFLTGECSKCTPTCIDYFFEQAYKGTGIKEIGQRITRKTMPCVNVSFSEKTKITIKETEIDQTLNLSKKESIILQPFNLDCKGESISLTVSIPENYIDVKALKCSGIGCYPTKIVDTTKLKCGFDFIKEVYRKEIYLRPEFMPIKINKTQLNLTSFKQALQSGKNKVMFYGEVFENLSVIMKMPSSPVKESENPDLKILGTPVILEFNKKEIMINTNITLEYSLEENIIEDSISIYINHNNAWKFISSKINKQEKTVTADILNVKDYFDENNQTKIALMGVVCSYCYNSSLTKIYQPILNSREAVILIHGLASSPKTFQDIINDIKLTQQPFQVWVFGYPSDKSIKENAEELAKHIEQNQENFDISYIVAHSLGGIIAQQALFYAYNENQKITDSYKFINKIKKVILIATPNEGSPFAQIYLNLFGDLVNKKTYNLFNPYSPIISQLVNGIIIPRIPNTEYYVIAGIKPYDFNSIFFKELFEELNDGIITTKSAQHIGEGYIRDKCKNYWEINVTHTELLDNPASRRLIEKIIAEEILKKEQKEALLGHNKYYEVEVKDCSPDDKYVVIGKKIKKQEAFDPTGCSCGNGYCGIGENDINCPSDCASFLEKEKGSLLGLIFMIIVIVLGYIFYKNKEEEKFEKIYNQRLSSYLRKNFAVSFDYGYGINEIRNLLVQKGWPKKYANKALFNIENTFNQEYFKLKGYIKEHLKKGYDEAYIKKYHVAKGFHKKMIEKAFRNERLKIRFVKRELKSKKRFFK